MATAKATKRMPKRSNRGSKESDPRADRLEHISKSTSQIVKEAAVLLDDEIASGIVAAKQMQQRFQKERKIDPGDFKSALTKFQTDAHQVVNLLNDQFTEMRSEENAEIVKRFTTNTHDLLDLVVELVNTGAELANQMVQQSNLTKKKKTSNGPRRR